MRSLHKWINIESISARVCVFILATAASFHGKNFHVFTRFRYFLQSYAMRCDCSVVRLYIDSFSFLLNCWAKKCGNIKCHLIARRTRKKVVRAQITNLFTITKRFFPHCYTCSQFCLLAVSTAIVGVATDFIQLHTMLWTLNKRPAEKYTVFEGV